MSDKQDQQIQVAFPDDVAGGAYTNHMMVTHTAEEFVMDFMLVAPPKGKVVARVVTSPSHMKRIIRALQENMERYEKNIRKITPSEEPKGGIGFNPN